MMRRVVLLLAAAALAAPPAAAQDMEVMAELRGRRLPSAYYERIAQDPQAFSFRRVWRGRGSAVAADGTALDATTHGELRMVVLLGLFADSPQPSMSGEGIHELLFGANPRGSLTDYYHQVSGGRVNVTGAVVPWVRSRLTRAQVAGEYDGLGSDGDVPGFMREMLRHADDRVDFGQFDNDGPDGIPNSGDDDRVVDLVAFNFEGPDATCGVTKSIWPHLSWISGMLGQEYATLDRAPNGLPIVLDEYIMQSATNCDGSPQDIAVMAHETGHAFGLPDMYDASYGFMPGERRWVVGCWALMGAGSWGCGPSTAPLIGHLPTQMGAWEKLRLGWVDAIRAEPGWRRQYTLRPVQESAQVLRVPLRGDNEYLLLEYRPNTGFDTGLPASGVLVYHVDSLRPFALNCSGCERLYRVSLVEADGDNALRENAAEGGNRGVAGDTWTGRRVFDAFSTPALKLNSGYPANVALEIEVMGPQALITVSTLPFVAPQSLLVPLLGSAGPPPTADERMALDHFGNRDGRYDLGDLRLYMRGRPQAVVPPS
jgi:M6 family metalloprotease-like protein